jgi:bifunctional DNA-binding transcriptional regulator/antitoxin component of YhaV-PrlF toxin-antitoxin module
MPIKVQRVLFRIGEVSLAVTLPKPWVTYNNLKPGDMVEIIANGELLICIKKQPPADDEHEVITGV